MAWMYARGMASGIAHIWRRDGGDVAAFRHRVHERGFWLCMYASSTRYNLAYGDQKFSNRCRMGKPCSHGNRLSFVKRD